MNKSTLVSLGLLVGFTAQANMITFQLSPAGTDLAVGLSPFNVVPLPAFSSGSGGTILDGIVFDTTTSVLHLTVGFGSAAGFTDLTGAANAMHLHGPASPGGIEQVLVDLQRYYFPAADLTKGGLIFGDVPWPTPD